MQKEVKRVFKNTSSAPWRRRCKDLTLPYVFPFLLKVRPSLLVTVVAFGQLSGGVTILLYLRSPPPGKKKGFEISICNGTLHSNANEMVRQSVRH